MRFPLASVLLTVLLAPAGAAQEVRNLRLTHRSGQTFVTWRESAQAGTTYRVYRSTTRLSNPGDLDQADLLGEVDDQSSKNQARSEVTGSEHGWIIVDGGVELLPTDGLFVHTLEESTVRSYYAVTSVWNGVEDRTLKASNNTNSSSLLERAARPQPVLQSSDAGGELYGHWVGDRDTPYLSALSQWPSKGFNFRFERGSAAGPRGLLLALHAAGLDYGSSWPHRFELPDDVDLLTLHDVHPYTSFSFWFGAHEALPGQPGASTIVSNYTQRRVLWTLDWIVAELGAEHDPERLYAAGGSMGAIGTMLLTGEIPGRLAAVLCRNGLYDPEMDDYRNPALFERLYGDFALNLATHSGIPIVQRFQTLHMAARNPQEDWPLIRTISGRNDETVGWRSSVGLMRGLASLHRPAVHYFDERTHTPQGYWAALERTLLARTCRVRRDRPALRFERCTLDDDMGDGTRTSGDPVGTVNGYLDYDAGTATSDATGLGFDVFLRASGSLDDSPSPTAWAALVPRRTGAFQLAPGERARFTLWQGATLVDEHVLIADLNGLLRTPRVPLALTQRQARFERWSPPPEHLFLGHAPIPGDRLQVIANGAPGAAYTLALGLGTSAGAPFRRLGVDYVLLSGVLDAAGFAEIWLPMPPVMPDGSWIWGRVVTGGQTWPLVGAAVQFWP
jgi:hypothetical protein